MQRFYKDVSTGPSVGGGFAVLLDQRPVRTPGKALMSVPTQELADALAAEWAAQGETINASTMPLTAMVTTAIDRAHQRAEITDEALKYLNGDLLCYRVDAPEALAAEQDALWSPWLDWFETRYGARLATTTGLKGIDHDEAAHKAVREAVEAMNDWAFTAFHVAVPLTGSVVLALALLEGAIGPEEAWNAALCEELYFERVHDLERHGLDPIEGKRRESFLRDLQAAQILVKTTRS
jgi:chaperone required for assembly of F1-ATPase